MCGSASNCGYGEAAARALPQAVQIADRWHLMENASAAFLNTVRKSMNAIRTALGAASVNLALPTCAERIQYEGYLRREAANAALLALARAGVPLRQIVKRTGHSRKTVGHVLRGLRSDVFRPRTSSLEAYLPRLDTEQKLRTSAPSSQVGPPGAAESASRSSLAQIPARGQAFKVRRPWRPAREDPISD